MGFKRLALLPAIFWQVRNPPQANLMCMPASLKRR